MKEFTNSLGPHNELCGRETEFFDFDSWENTDPKG